MTESGAILTVMNFLVRRLSILLVQMIRAILRRVRPCFSLPKLLMVTAFQVTN